MCAVAVSAARIASIAHPEPDHCAAGSSFAQSNAGSPIASDECAGGHSTHALRRCARAERQIERERAGSKAKRIVNACLCGSPPACDKTQSDETLVEARRREAGRRGRRHDGGSLVHTQRTALPCQVVDEAHAANPADALPGRGHLKRTNEQQQARCQGSIRAVLDSIAHTNEPARRRFALNAQAPLLRFPMIADGTGST